jgi:hypothetical protein
MKNFIRMSVLAAMMLIPFVATVQAGPTVSVSFGFGLGYSTCLDNDMDLDCAFVLDNSRVGVWVMLPSGRWALRVRNMWWNADYDDWAFGPWSYDYSVSYCYNTYNHFYVNIPFHPVLFHAYMNNHFRPWHERYYHHQDGRYLPRFSRHEDYRYNRYSNARVIRNDDHDRIIRHEEPVRDRESLGKRGNEHTTVTIHETKQPVRIDGGNRDTRIDNNRGSNRQPQVNRQQSETRDNSNHNSNVTRTEPRRGGRTW